MHVLQVLVRCGEHQCPRHLVKVGVIAVIPVTGIGGESFNWFEYDCGSGTILHTCGSVGGTIIHPG